jgi:hypothetical protein
MVNSDLDTALGLIKTVLVFPLKFDHPNYWISI